MPVELGTLAGSRRTPRKETTIHDLHVDAGAEFMWAADWRRAHHYDPPEAEVDAVRNGVGVIDVSTLGKFRVAGPQAVDLLERLYPNRFSDLRVGRLRYGVMLNDEGVILDDGAVFRSGEDDFFVTVTSGNTGALERWMTWWHADWRFDVQMLNVTGAFAAVNLAGPRARDVMQRLTDADVSAEGLPTCRRPPRRRGGAVARAAHGVRRRARFRDPLPLDVRGATCGPRSWTPVVSTGSCRSGWRRSGSSGWRSSTSWSGRTPTPSPTPSRRASAGW